jgi:hypothetical protein
MQRASESEALMTAIFDDDSLSNQDHKVADQTKPQEEQAEQISSAEQEEPVDVQVQEEVQKPEEEALNRTAETEVKMSEETLPSKPEQKEEMSMDEEFARLSEIPDDESFYDPWNRPKRVRRPVQNQVQIEIETNRVVFPLEVRAFAVDQIRQGATKVQVARDLDCPVSTVSGWWNRRDQIVQALNQSLSTESAVELSTAEKDNVEIPKPKVREQILTPFV